MPAVPPPLNVTSQSLCTVLDSTGAVATQVWVSTVSARDDSTSVMLAFSGEIDRVAVQAIEDPIVGVVVGAAHVLIDLGGVTFCDAGGIRLLLRLRQEVLAARGTLAVCDVSASVARVLEVMNIGGLDIPPPSHGAGPPGPSTLD